MGHYLDRLAGRIGHIYVIRRRIGHIYVARGVGGGAEGEVAGDGKGEGKRD